MAPQRLNYLKDNPLGMPDADPNAPIPFLQQQPGADEPPALSRIGDETPLGRFSMPILPPPPLPQVTQELSPVQKERGARREHDEQGLAKLNAPHMGQPGSSHPGWGGKILHGLAEVGNIAGNVLVPNQMAMINGTDFNNTLKRAGFNEDLAGIDKQEHEDAQSDAYTNFLKLRPSIETAKTTQRQAIADDKNHTMLAKAGLKLDDDGNPVADEASPAFQSRQIHDDMETSHQNLLDAEEAVKRASIDPNSPTYQLAVQRAHTARQNAAAAALRAQAYYGNFLRQSYNTGPDGNVLPGAPQIEDGDGHVTTVGTANAGQAVKAQSNVAQFNDVHGALDNLESTARQLVQSGGTLNSPAIIFALQHATGGTPSQFIQSLDKAHLTPAERAYVISVASAHENVQALRKAAGGTATDSSVAKLDALIPGATTPDLDYLLGQTKQIRATAERLGQGVTTVSGGHGVRGGHSNQGGEHAGPKVGDVVPGNDGNYRFKGGDRYDQKNWEKVTK